MMLDQIETTALVRLERAGLTLADAMQMTDGELLRLPCVGRKTLRYVRAFQGPSLPRPSHSNSEPLDEDEDWDGVDWTVMD